MRRFRLLNDNNCRGLKEGNIFNETDVINREGEQVMDFVTLNPDDWEEVFDKQLHKDTDLGYYVGIVLNNIMNNPENKGVRYIHLVVEAINIAEELIKQLEERKI